jgi:hypothetical protein
MTLTDELRMPFPVQASLLPAAQTGWKMDMQESAAFGNTSSVLLCRSDEPWLLNADQGLAKRSGWTLATCQTGR